MQRWPWYVPVFGVYPLLYIAASNPGQVQAGEVATVVAVGLLAAVAFVVLIRPLVGNWNAAGLGAAWVVLLFYLYGPVNEWWLDFLRESFEQRAAGQHWYNTKPQLVHSVAWALLAIGGIARIRRPGSPVNPAVTGGLNFVAALLAAFVAIQGIANHLRDSGLDTACSDRFEDRVGAGLDVPAGPDIYFIVLDGYARADILDEYYGFDNSPFLDGLRARGFQVSDASRSNFYWTFLSVGSSLNLDYVQALLGDALDPESRDRSQLYRLLRDNRAAQFPAGEGLSVRPAAVHLGRHKQQSICRRIPAVP